MCSFFLISGVVLPFKTSAKEALDIDDSAAVLEMSHFEDGDNSCD